MSDSIKAKAQKAAEREIPYDEKIAATYSRVTNYLDLLDSKRSLFIKGYLACHDEKKEDVILDEGNLCGKINGETVQFSNLEISILSLLLSKRGRVVSKTEISKAGWDGGFLTCDNSIRVAMSKLRRKVGREKIKCISMRGYSLVD